jgi:hypothetical protein
MKKRKMLKIISTLLVGLSFTLYIYYYPAPKKLTKDQLIPIVIFMLLYSTTILLLAWNFVSFKKSLLLTLIALSTLLIKIQRFIPIVTYAISIPLICVIGNKKEEKQTITPQES